LEYLVPRMRFDLREPKISIIRVHTPNFLSSWSPKYPDNLYKLVNSVFTRKQWLAQEKLSKDTTSWPNINWGCVFGCAKYDFV
jgi:hypothetical protein